MSLDITPKVPNDRQIVGGYGDGGFTITHESYQGSVLVFLNETVTWSGVLTLEGLQPVFDHPSKPEILVVGCGDTFSLAPEELRVKLNDYGIVLEWMDTAAACRTFNILAIEERPVAAALLAVE